MDTVVMLLDALVLLLPLGGSRRGDGKVMDARWAAAKNGNLIARHARSPNLTQNTSRRPRPNSMLTELETAPN